MKRFVIPLGVLMLAWMGCQPKGIVTVGGDKPIVIGDGTSIDINDGGQLTAENSNGTLTAPGDLVAKTSGSGTLMAAYQEAGVTKTSMCTGKGDCMIVVGYWADGPQPGACSGDAAQNVCGAVHILYLAATHSVTVSAAPGAFQDPPAPGGIYRRAGFHVTWVQWAQQNSSVGSNSGIVFPSSPTAHNSTVKVCFAPAVTTPGPGCTL